LHQQIELTTLKNGEEITQSSESEKSLPVFVWMCCTSSSPKTLAGQSMVVLLVNYTGNNRIYISNPYER
jgi:hypothetical protein